VLPKVQRKIQVQDHDRLRSDPTVRALFAVLVGVDLSEGRAFGDRAVNASECLELVRQDYNVDELIAWFGIPRWQAKAAHDAAIHELDREYSRELVALTAKTSRPTAFRRLAASPQIPRCNSQD
jgi:hypothetical protein